MSKKEKLITRFKTIPADFTYDELKVMLEFFGFSEFNKGRTSGSRVVFINTETKEIIRLHKPHPGNIVNKPTLKDVYVSLLEMGYL
jgi:hypothetical protein